MLLRQLVAAMTMTLLFGLRYNDDILSKNVVILSVLLQSPFSREPTKASISSTKSRQGADLTAASNNADIFNDAPPQYVELTSQADALIILIWAYDADLMANVVLPQPGGP